MLARSPHDRSTENPLMHTTDSQGTKNLLTIRGDHAKIEGKFQIADSIEIQCEVGGELDVGASSSLVTGSRPAGAHGRCSDHGRLRGNMIATGDAEIASTGRVMGNIKTTARDQQGRLLQRNVSKIKTAQARGGAGGSSGNFRREKGRVGPGRREQGKGEGARNPEAPAPVTVASHDLAVAASTS